MPIIKANTISATAEQIRYIECLAIDLLYNREDRNDHISDIVGREIRFLDSLSKAEASKVIGKFKSWKIA
jgi:hypothetical protein